MIRWTALLACTLALAACSTSEPEPMVEPAPMAEPMDDAANEPVMMDGVDFGEALDAGPVTSPVHVKMTAHGMTVHAAGEIIEGSGHHHILIDAQPIAEGTVIPSDAQHIHFGAGQTEADVELTPGEHTLTLQFANGMHESYGPAWSKQVKVTVTGEAP